jgi:uncharacterized protein
MITLFLHLQRIYKNWDSYCNQCGLCCYEKKRSWNGVITLDLNRPCEYLDTKTKLCKVYERRLKVCRHCRKVTIFHAWFSRYLPDSCGYVVKFRRSKKDIKIDK